MSSVCVVSSVFLVSTVYFGYGACVKHVCCMGFVWGTRAFCAGMCAVYMVGVLCT